MKTYLNIKLEVERLPIKVISDLLSGKDVNLIVSETSNEITNPNAPKYSERGVAVWIKESKFQ
jgi:hypothetical protein